ncbi:hypothetical protein KFK09_014691 [Dendrobium nobile]|uniref:Uncharacterized protein n=1 Tax=Dendrobium nobile TaxID=94219 RepID=A0A8T3B2V6_DENNO|nr:hypothetical protein KFK09_014691 [Dendrobium nobile]
MDLNLFAFYFKKNVQNSNYFTELVSFHQGYVLNNIKYIRLLLSSDIAYPNMRQASRKSS